MAWSLPVVEPEQRRRRRKRGSRAGVLVRLRKRENRPPLPSILLANVQSLDNKLDELRSRMAFQRDIKNCNVLVFTETWLDPSSIPDSAIVPEGLSIHRQDRTIHSGKSKGRRCLLHGEQQVVLRCGDYFYGLFSGPGAPHDQMPGLIIFRVSLHRLVMTAVYVPPDTRHNNKAMDELFGVIDRTKTSRPEAAFIVAGDFNSANLRKVLPRYHQHISCPTRRNLKRDGPVTRTIQQWSDQSDSALRDCFSTTEWCVFKDTDINTYTDAVIGYIGKCIDDVVPRITVQTFPNQKPWVNGEVRAKLKAQTDAYNSGDLEEYRKSRYALRRAISSTKRQYRDKVESHYKGSNTRSMWAGLKTLTDYKKKIR
ncbi:hypothetical protein L3Q82_009151 [Scortum barcoo]|uniref:Uncharacterized protein n=1 Tax=Scortum barcoo TaxID=214431 RepID=A0ACB8XB06_9TELE|nr:hypothetical protein L3Q82_009151 [Scortum barcoo]